MRTDIIEYLQKEVYHRCKQPTNKFGIATRGKTPDSYGDKVERITIQRTNEESMRHFDVVIDKIAYCSNDIRYVMDYVDCDKYIYILHFLHQCKQQPVHCPIIS